MNMTRFFKYIVFVLLLTGCTADLTEERVSVDGNDAHDKIVNRSESAIAGTIAVRFESSAESRLAECATRSGATRTGIAGVDAILDGIGGYAVEPVFVVTKKNKERVYAQGLHLWYELRFEKESDLEMVAKQLSCVAEVQRVQFMQRAQRISPQGQAVKSQHLSSVDTNDKIPFNDPYRYYQWALDNLGKAAPISNAGYVNKLPAVVEGADINILPAWKLCKGDPSIVVAVVDEGVMNTHEDLADNIWINEAELNGVEGEDDDDNGYKDDIYGYNFATMNNRIVWDLDKDSGHGTHVAGIISAVNDNGIGICGVAGGSGKGDGVKVMSIQIFYGSGGASAANISRGMQYAADMGAHILQNSWGYGSSAITSDANYRRRGMESDAIDYFVKYGGTEDGPIDGGLVIFAAGNEGLSPAAYPAAYEPCVAVASFSPSLKPAYYTNYGAGTDIVAPGGEMVYTNGAILSTLPERFAEPKYGNYGYMQGTSQACPHVSGIAALGLSYAKKLGKRYSADEFRSMLLSSTNDIDPYLTGEYKMPKADTGYATLSYPKFVGGLGAGYIDAYKLMLQIDGTPYTVIKGGVTSEIDLSPYFGDGVHNAKLSTIEISDEDKAAVGLGDCTYADGKLSVNCSKSGVATVTVRLLIGGSANSQISPSGTVVSKTFVLMVRSATAENGGWL